jgi:hypothetical protein
MVTLAADTFYYYKNDKKNYGSYLHFQEDSNALTYMLFGYFMNKLWIFEASIIASPNT